MIWQLPAIYEVIAFSELSWMILLSGLVITLLLLLPIGLLIFLSDIDIISKNLVKTMLNKIYSYWGGAKYLRISEVITLSGCFLFNFSLLLICLYPGVKLY